MQLYRNLSGESGVVAYACAPGRIEVRFRGGQRYVYTDRSAGAAAVREMQRLAQAGRGLSGYIAANVRDGYAQGPL